MSPVEGAKISGNKVNTRAEVVDISDTDTTLTKSDRKHI